MSTTRPARRASQIGAAAVQNASAQVAMISFREHDTLPLGHAIQHAADRVHVHAGAELRASRLAAAIDLPGKLRARPRPFCSPTL
jgi:hypothetical protein